MSERYLYGRSSDGTLFRTMQGHDDGSVTTTSHQDCEPIIEEAKFARELMQAHGTRGEIFRHVAKVPVDVYEQSVHEGWDEKKWTQWLNDGENRAFRVYEGRL